MLAPHADPQCRLTVASGTFLSFLASIAVVLQGPQEGEYVDWGLLLVLQTAQDYQ